MMNYTLVNKPGEWEAVPDTDGKYVAFLYDIQETKTGHVVATKSAHASEAKRLCRHLNMGGGFDGWTPAFFLERIPVSDSASDVLGGNEWTPGWTESKWSSDPK